MKLRLLAMGSIISVLGIGLIAIRGVETAYFGLLAVGVILLAIGAVWK